MNNFINLNVPQGADFFEEIYFVNDDLTPVNLTGYVLTGFFKSGYNANVSIPEAANVAGNTFGPINIVVTNAVNGNTLISIPSANTANIDAGEYVYDIFMTDNFGTVTRIIEGVMTVSSEVSINS